MVAIVCPSRETLLQYSLGMLSGEQQDALDRHLDSCPDCQATIMTLDDADDTVIGRLRMPLSSESVLAEPQLQDALVAAMAMPAGSDGVGVELPPHHAEEGSGLPGRLTSDMPETLGEYRLLEELGRGGMGRVYKALHTKLDRVVSVKVLPRGRVGDQKAIVRFEREMKAVGRLAHPNIVQAHDAREIEDTPVLIMEFIDGLDLAEIVRRVGPLPMADACELVRQTALALQCAHEHGLVHRDIKPSNIMLAQSGQVKLLDLGLARFFSEELSPSPSAGEEMTGTGQAMGTADYMAPEQASDSRTVDIRADLYSLGCTLYKLLSGRAPFSGPEYPATLDKLNAHVHQPAPSIRQLVPDAPEGLATTLGRLLAKDPDDRFATPAEVAEALAPWCVDADLSVLLQRAVEAGAEMARKRSPLPPGESHGEGRSSPKPLAASHRWKSLVTLAILLLLVGGFGFALGIIITIKKDGQQTTIEVPEGATALVDPEGNVDVTLPGQGRLPGVSPAADLAAVQGQWTVTKIEKGESTDKLPPPRSPSIDFRAIDRLEFRGRYVDTLSLKRGTGDSVEYTIDPMVNPKTIDIHGQTINRVAGELLAVGIYDLQGDRLKICLAEYMPMLKVEQRPTGFTVEPHSGNILFTLERYRPSEAEKAIQGRWTITSETQNGKPLTEKETRWKAWEFSGDSKFTPVWSNTRDRRNWRVAWAGKYFIAPSQHPQSITIFLKWDSSESHQGFSVIYKLDGDRLTVAYDGQRGTSPEQFESKPGSGVTLLVLERSKPAAGPRPSTPRSGERQTPSGKTKTPTTTDGKIEKQALLSLLREKAARQAEVMRSGQANYRLITRTRRLGMGEKFNASPLTTNMQGKVCFDGDNLCLDAEGRRQPSTTVVLGAEGHSKPSTAEFDDFKKHSIWTTKWGADLDGDIIHLCDPPGGRRSKRFDPRLISKVFVVDLERLGVKQVTYEGRTCYQLEEVHPSASVRGVQILDPERDFVLLRRETYYDNATRGQGKKLREDYPFYVYTFDYRKDEGSGIWAPVKCVWQQFETIPLAENRKPTLDREEITEFADYSFSKPPAKVFTLYHLSTLGARRLVDNRKGHAQENWYNLPALVNLADPTFVPNVKGLPPDLVEQWLKDAATAR